MSIEFAPQLYAADSSELISRYFWERHLEQRALQQAGFSRSHNISSNNHNNNMNVNPPNLGSITVRCQMLNEHLRVEVLNARNLKPPDLQAGEKIFSNFYIFSFIYMDTLLTTLFVNVSVPFSISVQRR